jgi:hypothetical protein
VGVQAVLERVGVPVADPAEPADPQGHSSADQSRVSRSSRMRLRKLAA